jgi:hypothetical protein
MPFVESRVLNDSIGQTSTLRIKRFFATTENAAKTQI